MYFRFHYRKTHYLKTVSTNSFMTKFSYCFEPGIYQTFDHEMLPITLYQLQFEKNHFIIFRNIQNTNTKPIT